MTTPSTARKAGPFTGTGAQTAWPFTFKVFAAADVKVTATDANGDEVLLVLNTDYTVSLNANQETSPGGTVNYLLPSGRKLSIVGDLDYDQPLDLPSGGNYSPTALENQLDRTVMQIQQLAEESSRSVKVPVTSDYPLESLTADLIRIADSADNLDTVAENITSVNVVAADLSEPVSEINTVATNIANVNTVGNNIANVNTVAGISANVTTVAGIAANVTAVAGNATNINAVAGNATNINAVAGNATNINAVAANQADIDAVAANQVNIDAVAANETNIDTVAGIAANVTAVAGNAANINTVAGNNANITTVAGISGNITTVAGISADVQTVADNVADITNFADVYQGPKASDPTLRNDGGALQAGDLYFNTTDDALRAYSGTQWVAGTAGTMNVQRFSGTGAQTAFTLASAPAGENNTQVYIGGVYQQKDSYSVSGTTLTFSSAPPSGTDNIEVVTIATLALGETDAALVSFLPSGSGAVERTVQSKLRDRVSVFDFMTPAQVMNVYLRVGTMDVAAEINNAITAVHAAGGGDLEFPPGRYKTSTSIIPKAGVTLKGLGVPSRVNAATSAVRIDHYGNNPGILVQTPASVSDIAVENIEFDGLNSGAFASGLTMDAQTNGGAIYGLRFRNCVFANFTNYQALQNGTVFDVSFDGCTFHNYGRAAGDCYHVGPNGVPGQQNFINCFFINCTSSSWAFRAEAACDPRFIGGTIGPSHAGANGISALGALYVVGTHIEGYTGSTAIGIAYRGSTGAFIAPSECHSFSMGVQIGDGTATTARGWTIAGGVGGNSWKDVVITAGGERDGTITQLSYIGGSYSVLDERLSVDGVAEVFRADGLNSTVIHGAFTPTLTGGSTPGTTTYTVQKGSYCLQGKVCTFVAWIGWSATTGTGQAIVGGLPFNSLADTYTPVTSFRYENFAIGANNSLQAYLGAISKTFGIETVNTAGGGAGTLAIPASGSLMITGSYIIG